MEQDQYRLPGLQRLYNDIQGMEEVDGQIDRKNTARWIDGQIDNLKYVKKLGVARWWS